MRPRVLLRLARPARSAAHRRGPDLSPTRHRPPLSGIFWALIPLLEADAGQVPLRARRFDLAISECGASLWCDPARWVPEAARVLRPGGRLVFHTTSVLLAMCQPGV